MVYYMVSIGRDKEVRVMADYRKLERWAEKLLDTGKRNNLISFRDTKGGTAEVLSPDPESIFLKCSVGRVFEVFDPKLPEDEIEEYLENAEIHANAGELSTASGDGDSEAVEGLLEDAGPEGKTGELPSSGFADNPESMHFPDKKASEGVSLRKELSDAGERGLRSREEYLAAYAPRMRKDRQLLFYAKTPNVMAAVRGIAKKAKEMQDETGINAAYLVFGFLKWREKASMSIFYEAPLLLVHVNLLTGTLRDPVKIEISDDDVVVNPTFRYYLQAEQGIRLPEYTDGEPLAVYFAKTAQAVRGTGWEVLDACKLGIFSFLNLNMYEDLKRNADRILANPNVRGLLGEADAQLRLSDSQASEDLGRRGWQGGTPGAAERQGHMQGVENAGTAGRTSGQPSLTPNPLIDLHTVVDADSSQIEAIEMAKSGKSFVLQGPPGTGKSQTITNIIAECLHDGKKVLFVSEKQAALNVVFDKLKKAGLADFCLELHSHKANKRAVIEELNRTLETPRSSVLPGAEEEIRHKAKAQAQLDGYAFALHKKRERIEKSLYELFDLYAEERNSPEVDAAISDIAEKGQTYLLGAVRALEQYAEYVPSVGENYRENPWFGFADARISYEGRGRLRADLAELSEAFRALSEETAGLRDLFGAPEMFYASAAAWQTLLELCGKSDVMTPRLLSEEAVSEIFPQLLRLKELAGNLVPLRNAILEGFTPSVFRELDGRTLYTRLTGEFASFFSRVFSGEFRNLVAGIRLHAKNGEKPGYEQAVRFAEQLMRAQEAQADFDAAAAPVQSFLGKCWQGPDTDWERVLSEMQALQSCLRLLEEAAAGGKNPRNSGETGGRARADGFSPRESGGVFAGARRICGNLPEMSPEEFAARQAEFHVAAERLRERLDAAREPVSRLRAQFSGKVIDFDHDRYDLCREKLNACLADFEMLGNWLGFMAVLEELEKHGLTAFVDVCIKEGIRPEETVGAFRRVFYRHWIENLLFTDPALASFTRIRQEQAVQTFAQKDTLQYEISKLQIRAELSKKRPNLELVAGGSAVAILRREGSKKRKQMPIRRLLSETGSLVQILKPCFLMSPLSVSTFLDPDKITFDTVVFDEASQIFPQDAVGAAYRGKQLIVVGDSRQMPPSDFFTSLVELEEDDEEVGDVGDFESILDVCSAALTTKRLSWHYRSHYEQLIAFSNRHFYDNRLVTFPSSTRDRKGIGVDFFFVEGTFDRRTKTNLAEAEAVVGHVYRHIEEYPERSLGVVAFSAAQQGLIDRLLLKKRMEEPSKEWFFRADRPEPFFVKNLETVQGDERDTIIFSVAYAKDREGRFLLNFGPLNREGGERRLNVAVTRAKDNVQLISSIRDADIDLTRTNSEGVRLLRAYLSYAEKGEAALEGGARRTEEEGSLSSFEKEVAETLREGGFSVDAGVGCSEQRVGLALRQPEGERYLLAIESDGGTYRNARNARDRDCLRQRVLENMGWQFCRVWSTEWYRNREVELERLLRTAKEAVERDKKPVKPAESDAPGTPALLTETFADAPLAEAPLAEAGGSAEPGSQGFAGAPLAEAGGSAEPGSQGFAGAPLAKAGAGAASGSALSEGFLTEEPLEEAPAREPSEILLKEMPGEVSADRSPAGRFLKKKAPGMLRENVSSEAPLKETRSGSEEAEALAQEAEARFSVEETETAAGFPEYRQADAMALLSKYTFQRAIRRIAKVEAPLSEEYLLKRIVQAFGREKVTRVVVGEYNSRMEGCERLGLLRRDGFLYLQDMGEIRLRVPGVKREVKYIALEELADGLLAILRQSVTANRDGLYKTLANLLGYARASDSMAERFEAALWMLEEEGRVTEADGVLGLTEA